MRALIDGDILVYRCGFAAEHNRYFFNGDRYESYADLREALSDMEIAYADVVDEVTVEREIEEVSHALANVKSVMNTILEEINTADYIVFLSQGECFRNDIATIMEYKGNRRDAAKPVHYDAIREYLTRGWAAQTFNSIEADDALAMAQGDDSVIVSIDKDLLQVPGYHYNWVKDERLVVTPEVGRKKFWAQVLTGDSTDNIPGIYGVGPKTAKRMIEDVVMKNHPAITEDDFYFMLAADQWDEYLHSEKPKPFIDLQYHDDVNAWSYEHWSGAAPQRIMVPTEDIVMEICKLISVGGEDAKQALEESGEEVPLSRKTEGKAAATA